MPDFQRAAPHQKQDDNSRHPGCQVADHHCQFPIPAVHQYAREWAEHDSGYVRKEDHGRECGCQPGLLIQPDPDRKGK